MSVFNLRAKFAAEARDFSPPFGFRVRLYGARSVCVALGALIFGVFLFLPGIFSGSFSDSFSGSRLAAAEEWTRFLEELDARGYDDVAVNYLKMARDSGDAPPELASELDFRVGLSALESISTAPSGSRPQLVAQARSAFERFIAENPNSPSFGDANAALARLLLAEGARTLAEANKTDVAVADQERLRSEARVAFADAKPRLDAALKAVRDRAQALDGSDASTTNDKNLAAATFLDLRVRSASLKAQTARTFAVDSQERKDGLAKARAEFAEIAATYQQYAGSFQARYFEAEIARELGDVDAAFAALSELAVLPFEEQFYVLKTRSLLLYCEIVLERDVPAESMNVVKKFNEWRNVERLPTTYYASAEGLQIHLLAARAIIRLEKLRRIDQNAYNVAGRKTFTDATDPTYKIMSVSNRTKGANSIVNFALKTLSFVADRRGDAALEAQELLKDPLFEGIDRSQFSFAKTGSEFEVAANAALNDAALFAQARRDALGSAPDVADLARRRADEAAENAYSSFQKAFELVDEKTPLDELDRLRFQFASVCFATNRLDEALTTSETLVRESLDFADAPQAATVALRAAQTLLKQTRLQTTDDEKIDAAKQRVVELADYVVERWEKADENDFAAAAVVQEAFLAQMELAIASNDVVAARALLEKIPETSASRSTAELRLGQSLWNAWNDRKNAESPVADELVESGSVDRENVAASLAALLDGAEEALFNGLERRLASARGVSENDYSAIYSALLLAQIYEQKGDFDGAEKWLTHPVIGPLVVVRKTIENAQNQPDVSLENSSANETSESPTVENESNENSSEISDETANSSASDVVDDNFQMATLALALRVLTNKPDRFEEAEETMAQLEALARRAPGNSAKLTAVYLRLGKRFEERLSQLKSAADEGDAAKQEELDAATKGFETFLKRVSERDEGNGYGSLRWVADSFLGLGRGLSGTLSDPPPEAIAYFAQAGRTYQAILRKIDADPNFAPNESARLAVSLKIVECLRLAGAFTKAFEQAKALVKTEPNNLDVQFETARTLQCWGRKDSKYYLTAIVGGGPDSKGRNVVWGWNGIIAKLAPSIGKNPRYQEAFYDAYLEKTRCRFLYARRLIDKEEKERQLKNAEDDLRRLYQTHPDLGGAAMFAKFDSAFKNFQRMRGEKKPLGFREDAKKTADGAAKGALKNAR